MSEQNKSKQVPMPTINRTVKEVKDELNILVDERQKRLNQLAGADPTYRDMTGRIEALQWLLKQDEDN